MSEFTSSPSACSEMYVKKILYIHFVYWITRWRPWRIHYQDLKIYMQSTASSFVWSPSGFIFEIAWVDYMHRGFSYSMQRTTPRRRDKWPKGKFFLFTVWNVELKGTNVGGDTLPVEPLPLPKRHRPWPLPLPRPRLGFEVFVVSHASDFLFHVANLLESFEGWCALVNGIVMYSSNDM